jgi:hypothetical protein
MNVAHRGWVGRAATFFGALALAAAVLPTWVLPVVMPPDPVDKVVVDTAQRIKDRVIAKARGIEYQEPKRRIDWYEVFAALAMFLGVLALALAAASLVSREPWRYAGAASALGLGAIVFQFSIAVAGGLMVILLLFVILSALNISL